MIELAGKIVACRCFSENEVLMNIQPLTASRMMDR